VQQIDLERKTITMEPGSGTKRKPRGHRRDQFRSRIVPPVLRGRPDELVSHRLKRKWHRRALGIAGKVTEIAASGTSSRSAAIALTG